MLEAVLFFSMIIVLGESLAVLIGYSSNVFLQYVSANARSLGIETGVLIAIAFGSTFRVFRRPRSDSVSVDDSTRQPQHPLADLSQTTNGKRQRQTLYRLLSYVKVHWPIAVGVT